MAKRLSGAAPAHGATGAGAQDAADAAASAAPSLSSGCGCARTWAAGDGDVADINAACGYLEPFLAPIASRLHVSRKRRCVGPQDFELGALRRRDIGRYADGFDRQAVLGLLIEAKRTRAARQSGEQLH